MKRDLRRNSHEGFKEEKRTENRSSVPKRSG